MFDNVQQAVDFSQRNMGAYRMPSIAKKRLLRKKFKRIFSAPFKRQKQRRLVDQCLRKKLKKSKRLNLKFEVELTKIVHCFLDGPGNYDSTLVAL